jgi:twitching motility two-component system response regulator PilH
MRVRRITIIDDSPEVLEVLGDALGGEGIEVTLLGGRATLPEIAGTRPDLLIVDLRLGTDHLPGWELIRHVQAHPVTRDVPVIVCSGALDQMRGYGGAAIGARTYLLPKPFSLADLDAVLGEALDNGSTAAAVTPVPVGEVPEFSRDPHGWFARIGDEIGTPGWRSVLASIEPAVWINRAGHPWRVVRTPRGVEVRPDLVSPFLRYTNQPMVTALGLSDEVEVELTTDLQRWVGRSPCNAFDVGALGSAMLEERRLPHDNLPQLFPPRRAAASVGGAISSFRVGEAETLQR